MTTAAKDDEEKPTTTKKKTPKLLFGGVGIGVVGGTRKGGLPRLPQLPQLLPPSSAAASAAEKAKAFFDDPVWDPLRRYGRGAGSSGGRGGGGEERKKAPSSGTATTSGGGDDNKFAARLERYAREGVGQRFCDVFNAVAVPVAPEYVAPVYLKTTEESQFLKDAVTTGGTAASSKGPPSSGGVAVAFGKLRPRELAAVVGAFEKMEFRFGGNGKGGGDDEAERRRRVLVEEGSKVTRFYVVQIGCVRATGSDEQSSRKIGPGECFGELSLLYDYPSEATYEVVSGGPAAAAVVWSLDQVTFKRAVLAFNARENGEAVEALQKVELFGGVDVATLKSVARALTTSTYYKGEHVLRKADGPVKAYHVVQKGSVRATDIEIGGEASGKYGDLTFKAGEGFGEASVVSNIALSGNVVALEDDTVVLTLPRRVFIKEFGDLKNLVQRSTYKKLLRALPLDPKYRRNLGGDELEILVSLIRDRELAEGHVLVQEGRLDPHSNALYFVRSGRVGISKREGAVDELMKVLAEFIDIGPSSGGGGSHTTTTVSEGGYFGIEGFRGPGDGRAPPPAYTATALEDGTVVGELRMSDVWSVLAGAVPSSDAMAAVPFNRLRMHRLLGAGTFGKVWLCSDRGGDKSAGEKEGGNAYALKVQSKRKTIEYGQVKGVIQEKKAMVRLDHPFIIKLVASYKDDKSLYMLMHLYQGGDLRWLVSHRSPGLGVPEPVARFYAANILLGLRYMHRRRTLHRDLKPENVLLSNRGYTVLVDLGFSRVCTDKCGTVCGTVSEASEVIDSSQHAFPKLAGPRRRTIYQSILICWLLRS